MRFITFGYLFFFIIVFISYWSIKNKKAKLWIIAISSSLFYASWSIEFFLHFISFVFLNFFFSQLIRNSQNLKKKKIWLSIILILDISNLFFFKYLYFIIKILYDITDLEFFKKEVLNSLLLHYLGQESIVLPLAISFYTFQMIAYVVDTYKIKIQRKDSLLEFYVFILFFPQLVAGPIMRHSDFFYQLDHEIQLTKEKVIRGYYLIFIGLIKKVIIADNIASIIDPIFLNPLEYNGFANFLAGVGYAIRVYGDFSGYTDIARGSAHLLGFSIPENFEGPFLSISISEFWRRWHVTLSSWLRDYIYITLGGSRVSPFRTYVNLIITFTLGGLWHGANYTYLFWGFFNGILLLLERLIPNFNNAFGKSGVLQWLGILYTFFFFSIGLLFFNAPDIQHSFWMFEQIFFLKDGKFITKDSIIQFITFLVFVFVFNYFQYYKNKFKIKETRDIILLCILGIVVVWLLGNYSPKTQSFIYFQF